MKAFRDFMEMFKWVLIIALVFIGWGVISVYGTVLMVVLYPLYGAIVLGGALLLKYQERDIEGLSSEVLKKEIYLRAIVITASIIILVLTRNQNAITFEIMIAVVLTVCIFITDMIAKIMHLLRRTK